MRMKSHHVTAVALTCGLLWSSAAIGAVEYPLNLTLDAKAKTASTFIMSNLTISIDRLMEESRRVRVTDALKFNGYPGFLKVLRALPPVGTIGLSGRQVEVRYAHEAAHAQGRRLVLVADQALFFLATDTSKNRAGYELTMVELLIGNDGSITGTMTGAARVKPGGEGAVVVDDFAATPVSLSGRLPR